MALIMKAAGSRGVRERRAPDQESTRLPQLRERPVFAWRQPGYAPELTGQMKWAGPSAPGYLRKTETGSLRVVQDKAGFLYDCLAWLRGIPGARGNRVQIRNRPRQQFGQGGSLLNVARLHYSREAFREKSIGRKPENPRAFEVPHPCWQHVGRDAHGQEVAAAPWT